LTSISSRYTQTPFPVGFSAWNSEIKDDFIGDLRGEIGGEVNRIGVGSFFWVADFGCILIGEIYDIKFF